MANHQNKLPEYGPFKTCECGVCYVPAGEFRCDGCQAPALGLEGEAVAIMLEALKDLACGIGEGDPELFATLALDKVEALRSKDGPDAS